MIRIIDRTYMSLTVYRGRKVRNQTNTGKVCSRFENGLKMHHAFNLYPSSYKKRGGHRKEAYQLHCPLLVSDRMIHVVSISDMI